MLLLQGDCLELLKEIPDESIDLIFCDLPYGQTSCKWDCKIDLGKLWSELLRVKKLRTPLFFTTTTKFGVELINSSPKICPFRYDIVWAKTHSTGFLCARKMPMRKHEMIYVFYEKLPLYDLSSHQQKFVKHKENTAEQSKTQTYGKIKRCPDGKISQYDPPLPVSVLKPEVSDAKEDKHTLYGEIKDHLPHTTGTYEPLLPTSMLEIKSTRGKHSTEKPVPLLEWMLKYYSKEGDVVLDPTMGSGSMGAACQNLNRDFVGFELDEEIFEDACERLIPR